MSKYHIVGNHMSWLISIFSVVVCAISVKSFLIRASGSGNVVSIDTAIFHSTILFCEAKPLVQFW